MVQICRICFEEETEINNKLIYPCLCDGSSKYIHINCLEQWRNSGDELNYERRTKCMECKYSYKITYIHKSFRYFNILSLTKKNLVSSSICSFVGTYIVGLSTCKENYLQSWIETTNVFICYNITPGIIIILYLLLIIYYYFLLKKQIYYSILSLLIRCSLLITISILLLFILGSSSIILISGFMNMYIYNNYYKHLQKFLIPKEIIHNYEPSPQSNSPQSNSPQSNNPQSNSPMLLSYIPPNILADSSDSSDSSNDSESIYSHSSDDSESIYSHSSDSSINLSDLEINSININIIHI